MGGGERQAACCLLYQGSQRSKRQGEHEMAGDRNVVSGLVVEVEEASQLSVERAARGRENDMWLDEGMDSARLPFEVQPTRPPLCCDEQDIALS